MPNKSEELHGGWIVTCVLIAGFWIFFAAGEFQEEAARRQNRFPWESGDFSLQHKDDRAITISEHILTDPDLRHRPQNFKVRITIYQGVSVGPNDEPLESVKKIVELGSLRDFLELLSPDQK